MFPTTRDAVRRSTKRSVPYGKERYCRQCEKLFLMIDRSYPTYVVGDLLLAPFTKVALTWCGKDSIDTTMWSGKMDLGQDHKSLPSCPGHRRVPICSAGTSRFAIAVGVATLRLH